MIGTLRMNKWQLGLLLVLMFFGSNVFAVPVPIPSCYTKPDLYELGTGANISGLCTAGNSAAAVIAAEAQVVIQTQSAFTQAEELAQNILTVQNLVIQTEQLIKDIQENPLQVIVPDANQIIRNQNRINKLAQDIDKNSSQVGSNLIKNLEMPETVGLGQGSKFQLWAETRKNAIDENYDTIKAFLGDLKKENISITQAINNLNGAKGQRANARALSNAAGQQLSTLGKIEELLFKMLSLQSAESGAKLQAEIDASVKPKKPLSTPKGFMDSFEGTEKYIGPGKANSTAF